MSHCVVEGTLQFLCLGMTECEACQRWQGSSLTLTLKMATPRGEAPGGQSAQGQLSHTRGKNTVPHHLWTTCIGASCDPKLVPRSTNQHTYWALIPLPRAGGRRKGASEAVR